MLYFVLISVNRNFPVLDPYDYGFTVEIDQTLTSMARLTSDVLRNASEEHRIWQ